MIDYRIDEARIQLAKERINKAYRLEEPDQIPVVEMAAVTNGYTIRQITMDPDCMLRSQLNRITASSRLDTDYVPYLEPWICVPMFAEAFGAEIVTFEHNYAANKVIIYDEPEDVYKLKYPKPFTTPLWKLLKQSIEYFQQQTDGRLLIAATDPQGPFTTASLLWDSAEFFTACYTNPKEVHYLMQLLTDQFIEYYDAQLALIENPAFPGHSFPCGEAGTGISISDDNVVMVSPAMFEEFNLPYLTQISNHFGGLYYHSCGTYDHMLTSILKIPGLRAINWHTGPYEMTRRAYEQVQGKCAVWTGPSLPSTGWQGNRPPMDQTFADFFIPEAMCCGGRGVIVSGYGSYSGEADLPADVQNAHIAHVRALLAKHRQA